MDPNLWGPELWKILHALAWKTDIGSISANHFIACIQLLPLVLPCSVCQQHSKDYIEKNSPTSPFFEWSVDFHNSIKQTSYDLTLATYRELLHDTKPFCEEDFIRIVLYIACTNPDAVNAWIKLWNTIFLQWHPYEDFQLPTNKSTDQLFSYYSVQPLKQRIYDIINGGKK